MQQPIRGVYCTEKVLYDANLAIIYDFFSPKMFSNCGYYLMGSKFAFPQAFLSCVVKLAMFLLNLMIFQPPSAIIVCLLFKKSNKSSESLNKPYVTYEGSGLPHNHNFLLFHHSHISICIFFLCIVKRSNTFN